MIRLQQRTIEESYAFHQVNTPSPDFTKTGQYKRIIASRKQVLEALRELGFENNHLIVELGAGQGDTIGYFSKMYCCFAYEANVEAARMGKERFSEMEFRCANIETIGPFSCDILILTEILEHLNDPEGLVKRWLPLAKYAVISSPIEGDLNGYVESGHQWSFTLEDMRKFIELGNHQEKGVIFERAFYQWAVFLTEVKH